MTSWSLAGRLIPGCQQEGLKRQVAAATTGCRLCTSSTGLLVVAGRLWVCCTRLRVCVPCVAFGGDVCVLAANSFYSTVPLSRVRPGLHQTSRSRAVALLDVTYIHTLTLFFVFRCVN